MSESYTVETSIVVKHGDKIWSTTDHTQHFNDRADLGAYELALVDALRAMWADLQAAGAPPGR